MVTILLYTVYGIPSVYYGSEFGIEGQKEQGSDWNLRPALSLADYADAYENNEITKLCRKLGQLKKEYAELTNGTYQELILTNRQFAFGRILDGKECISALNCDDAQASFEIPLCCQNATAKELYGIDNFTDMIGDETVATDPEALVEFLTEKGHPALGLDPMM